MKPALIAPSLTPDEVRAVLETCREAVAARAGGRDAQDHAVLRSALDRLGAALNEANRALA